MTDLRFSGPQARPGGSEEEKAAVWSTLIGIYDAYRTGSRAAIDVFMHPDATIWDSDTPQLLQGKADLDRVRDARPTGGAGHTEPHLSAYDEVIDVFDGLALARYWLRVEHSDGRTQLVRNTAVLAPTRLGGGDRWLVVHLHEDVQAAEAVHAVPNR